MSLQIRNGAEALITAARSGAAAPAEAVASSAAETFTQDAVLADHIGSMAERGVSPAAMATQLERVAQQREEAISALRRSLGGPTAFAEPVADTAPSDQEMIGEMIDVLADYESVQIDGYHDVMNGYYEFLSDVTALMGNMSNYVAAYGDNDMFIDVGAIRRDLQAIKDKWSTTPILEVDTLAEAEWWSEELDLEYTEVNGKYCFYVDLTPIDNMLASFDTVAAGQTGVIWDTARFSAWQTGFNSQRDEIQTTVQVYAEQYSAANSRFNEFVKVISSTISQMAEAEKTLCKF
jgi:invasin D